MSWDKNTLNESQIPAVREILDELGVEYEYSVRGTVHDSGNNANNDSKITLHRLVYGNKVILEQLYRYMDCDVDDVIISCKFNKEEEPKDFALEVQEEVTYDKCPVCNTEGCSCEDGYCIPGEEPNDG